MLKFNILSGKFDLVSDAATTTKQGIVKLAQDLGGTADLPQVKRAVGHYSQLVTQDLTATSISLTFVSLVFTDGTNFVETLNGNYTISGASAGSVNQLDKGVLANNVWYHYYGIAKTDGTTGGSLSPLVTGGSGATVSYTAAGNVITAVTANAPAGGSGYQVGDVCRVTSGDGTALVRVATVSGTAVATWNTTVYYAGAASYTTATGQATTTTPTLPTGYTMSRYLGATFYTSNAFQPFRQENEKISYKSNIPNNVGGNLTYQTAQTKIVLDDLLPMTATECEFMIQLANSAVSDLYFQINNSSTAGNFISWCYNPAGKVSAFQIIVPVLTAQTLWYLNATAGSSTVQRFYMKRFSVRI